MLLLSWSEDKLLEHPQLAEPSSAVEVEPPGPASHMGGDMNAAETLKEAAEGAAIGAGLGALVGIALTPLTGLALAAFFAAGGALLGASAGASQDRPAKEQDDLAPERHNPAFLALEQRLRDPRLETMGLVNTTAFGGSEAPVEAIAKNHSPQAELRR
jgi:hypothetical protein